MVRSTIQKWGNSQAIRLPKAILDIAQLSENEPIQIIAEPNRIIIQKSKMHKPLRERLAGFDGTYIAEEWDTGLPVGKEVL